MWAIYSFAVFIYSLSIKVVSLFNPKAKKWVEGRKNIFQTISNSLQANEKRIWFHCPSYGEYEQGKPVLSEIKKIFPDHKIVLTFFSPSGYEIGKKDIKADYVFYLPMDSKKTAEQFLDLVQPQKVFFVKYDFWYFYMDELYKRKIPFYYFSCNFRENQYFFKWYGSFFAKQLRKVSHFFVQNQRSLLLLNSIQINSVTISGDTRFDRVFENSSQFQSISLIEKFCENKKIFVAGSTWPEDEQVLMELIKQKNSDWKFIIVPHEINRQKIESLKTLILNCGVGCKLFTEFEKEPSPTDAVIINSIGMLSRIYHYATIAYIGGGFGKGIHNTLEAAVFGSPILFGPNYKKFNEAIELIESGVAFSVSNANDLVNRFNELNDAPEKINEIKEKNRAYIQNRTGATKIITTFLGNKA